MNIDLAIALAVIGVSALILQFKSHVKFVALGVFIGFVLLDTIPLETYFTSPEATSMAKVVLLVIPAFVLGINHTVDKRKTNFLWKIIFVLVFTLFFLSSITHIIPPAYQDMIVERSIVGWRILSYFTWYTLAAAVLVLIDSVQHRSYMEKEKKRKKSTSTKSKSSSS